MNKEVDVERELTSEVQNRSRGKLAQMQLDIITNIYLINAPVLACNRRQTEG